MDSWSAINASNERIQPSIAAVKGVRDYINRTGLFVEERCFGNYAKVSTCTISDSDGFSTEGHGKGIGNQCAASALFEALEHYYYFSEKVHKLITSSEIDFSTNGKYLIGGSPPVEKMFLGDATPLSCIKFKSILHPDTFVEFPLALLNPYYKAQSEAERKAIRNSGLYRYATNSGTASGQNRDEALLHAVLELIERDAVGLLIVKCILRKNSYPVCIISREILPNNIVRLFDSISEQADAKLEIYDITTALGVPTFLCSLKSNEFGKFRFFGSGASCLPEYALERAMLEAFQGYCLQFKFGKTIQPTPINTSPISPFEKVRLEHGQFEPKGGYIFKKLLQNLESSLVGLSSLPCREQVTQLAHHLANFDVHLYSRDILTGEISIVQVISPQLERFYLMTKGMPVGPGSRARHAYKSQW